mmetsp:Transcript_6649/g.8370  ORF Transcript_6649/g.8370 Transcript_6649/m.8370 type:complete len:80 (-) Transcript_6649:1022-1261(-)
MLRLNHSAFTTKITHIKLVGKPETITSVLGHGATADTIDPAAKTKLKDLPSTVMPTKQNPSVYPIRTSIESIRGIESFH